MGILRPGTYRKSLVSKSPCGWSFARKEQQLLTLQRCPQRGWHLHGGHACFHLVARSKALSGDSKLSPQLVYHLCNWAAVKDSPRRSLPSPALCGVPAPDHSPAHPLATVWDCNGCVEKAFLPGPGPSQEVMDYLQSALRECRLTSIRISPS